MKKFFYLLITGLYFYSHAIYQQRYKKNNPKKFFAVKKGKKKQRGGTVLNRSKAPEAPIIPSIISYLTIILNMELKLNEEFIETIELEKMNTMVRDTLSLLNKEITEKDDQIRAAQKNQDELQEFSKRLNLIHAKITKKLSNNDLVFVTPKPEIASPNIVSNVTADPELVNDSFISSADPEVDQENEESDNEE